MDIVALYSIQNVFIFWCFILQINKNIHFDVGIFERKSNLSKRHLSLLCSSFHLKKLNGLNFFQKQSEQYWHHVCSIVKQEVKGSHSIKFSARRGISELTKITSPYVLQFQGRKGFLVFSLLNLLLRFNSRGLPSFSMICP